jgi:hypothetical protein
MFYRTTKKHTATPYYHIRSAISSDGRTFTREGVCIEINSYDASSIFQHVGHSEFYYDAGNNLRAILTAKDTSMSAMQPDALFSAQSSDEGLSWSGFVKIYPDCHDPVVIRDSSGTFHAYFTYLNTGFRTKESADGVGWLSPADTMYMIESGDTITESSSPVYIADLGAAVDSLGTIILFSNHSTTLGPWTHIAMWEETSVSILSQSHFSSVSIYPNPSSGEFHVSGLPEDKLPGLIFSVTDISGKVLLTLPASEQFTLGTSPGPGLYFLTISDKEGNRMESSRLFVY